MHYVSLTDWYEYATPVTSKIFGGFPFPDSHLTFSSYGRELPLYPLKTRTKKVIDIQLDKKNELADAGFEIKTWENLGRREYFLYLNDTQMALYRLRFS